MDVIEGLKPIFISMSLVGLYHMPSLTYPNRRESATEENNDNQENNDASSDITSQNKRPRAPWYHRGSRYYCLFMCFVLWFHFIRTVVSFWVRPEYQPNMLQLRIPATLFYLQGALNGTLMYLACRNPDCLRHVTVTLNEHLKKYPSSSLTPLQSQRLKKQIMMFLVISWSIVFVNTAVTMSIVLEWTDMLKPVAKVLTDPFGLSIPAKAASIILLSFSTCAWLLPINLSTGLMWSLRAMFKILNTNLEEVIARSKESYPAEVEVYRVQHSYLCASVRVLDRAVGKIIFVNYATNLPLMCFLVYRLIYSNMNSFELAFVIFWLILCAFNVFFVSLKAAVLHEASHSPSDCLHDVNTTGATQEQLTQLILFLTRVSGDTTIGFSPLGIVTITKETVLSICGLLVTYILILIQYEID